MKEISFKVGKSEMISALNSGLYTTTVLVKESRNNKGNTCREILTINSTGSGQVQISYKEETDETT